MSYLFFSGTACMHDSGSPLICEDMNGKRELAGIIITIHGPDIYKNLCTPGKQIIVFSRISYYAPWILDIVKNGEPSLTSKDNRDKTLV